MSQSKLSKPLRIALVLIEPPLPFGNAASRWYYVLLKELVARGHSVQCYCACSNPEEIDRTKKLFAPPEYDMRYYLFPKKNSLISKYETLLRPKSFQFSEELKKDIKASTKYWADILHVEHLWSAWLGMHCPEKTLVSIHYLQNIDLQFYKATSFKEKMQNKLVFRTEKKLVKKFNFIRCGSPRLAPLVLNWNPKAEVSTIPLGIDSSLYEYTPDQKRSKDKTVFIVGNMKWYPGQSATYRLLNKLWPKIKEAVPDAKLQIVGWSARSVFKKYLEQSDVEIKENVPDIKPYFEKASVMLYAPSRGSGMKIKVLESMAFGIPLVTTSEGIEGIPAIDDIHGGFAESDESLISRTIDILNDTEKQNRYRSAARQLLEEHCGPSSCVDRIEFEYQKILNKQST